MAEEPVDLSPFLKRGLHYSVADFLYRHIFQHIDNLLERISAHFTRQWCEEQSPELRKQNTKDRFLGR